MQVNYAWKCLMSSQGFVWERFKQPFFDILNQLHSMDVPRVLYSMATYLDKELFWKPEVLLEQVRHAPVCPEKRAMELDGHAIVSRVVITPTRLVFFQPDIVQVRSQCQNKTLVVTQVNPCIQSSQMLAQYGSIDCVVSSDKQNHTRIRSREFYASQYSR